MSLMYTQEAMKEMIRYQILPQLPEELSESVPEYETVALLVERNAVSASVGCVTAVSPSGLLVVRINSFDAEKAEGWDFIRFSDIQGIRIRKKFITVFLEIQMKGGDRWKFQISNRSTKRLPDQKNNVAAMSRILESLNLHEMKHSAYRKAVRSQWGFVFLYLVTLLAVMSVPLSLFLTSGSLSFSIVVILLTFIVHFVLFFMCGTYFHDYRDRKFRREYRAVVRQYLKTDNAGECYERLKWLAHLPVLKEGINNYYMSLSIAAYRIGNVEEALECLQKVRTEEDEALEKIVMQQEEAIRNGEGL